jgi:hypothetical protein
LLPSTIAPAPFRVEGGEKEEGNTTGKKNGKKEAPTRLKLVILVHLACGQRRPNCLGPYYPPNMRLRSEGTQKKNNKKYQQT